MEVKARSALLTFAVILPLAGDLICSGAKAAPPMTGSSSRTCIFDRSMLWTPPGTCRPRAISYPPEVTSGVRRAIYDSAITFGVPYPILLRIARCESALHPHAANGSHFGLFQFLPDTFVEGVDKMRSMTGIRARSYWSARDASYVAGFLFAIGESPRWTCS